MSRTQDDTHVFANGLTRADIREAVTAALITVARKKARSAQNCAYVRKLMREREPRIAAALDKAVRDA